MEPNPDLTHVASSQSQPPQKPPVKRDAFAELLSPKPKQQKPSTSKSTSTENSSYHQRKAIGGPCDALGAYILNPQSFPSSTVIYYNDSFVAIHDAFPKSTVHLLLLPRDPKKTRLHPFEALEDPEFLAQVKEETWKLRKLAASELRRRYGRYSAQERERQEALIAEEPPESLPQGRDWEAEIKCGIHAHPSMNHLHVHVISKDRYSDRLKHRKHYNSFSTPFFVDLEDFPLDKGDPRRHPGKEGYLKRDLICWRCDRGFGSRFSDLKTHLEQEFDQWKRL